MKNEQVIVEGLLERPEFFPGGGEIRSKLRLDVLDNQSSEEAVRKIAEMSNSPVRITIELINV